MSTSRGSQLAQEILQRVEELKRVCAGVDEATAGRAPSQRWSPKQILSHLCGPEGHGHLPIFTAFLKGETPTIDLDAENPFWTTERQQASFAALLSECEREYQGICRFATELTDEQLARKAHVPKLKDSPLGEYPTLEQMISGLGGSHLQFHIDHLRQVLQELSA